MSVVHLLPLSFPVPLQAGLLTAYLIFDGVSSSSITDSSDGHCKGQDTALQFTSTQGLFPWSSGLRVLGEGDKTGGTNVVLLLGHLNTGCQRHSCEQILHTQSFLHLCGWEASPHRSRKFFLPVLVWFLLLTNPDLCAASGKCPACYCQHLALMTFSAHWYLNRRNPATLSISYQDNQIPARIQNNTRSSLLRNLSQLLFLQQCTSQQKGLPSKCSLFFFFHVERF